MSWCDDYQTKYGPLKRFRRLRQHTRIARLSREEISELVNIVKKEISQRKNSKNGKP